MSSATRIDTAELIKMNIKIKVYDEKCESTVDDDVVKFFCLFFSGLNLRLK